VGKVLSAFHLAGEEFRLSSEHQLSNYFCHASPVFPRFRVNGSHLFQPWANPSIYRKLGVSRRAEAIAVAQRLRLF
jgi:hypothetical protein